MRVISGKYKSLKIDGYDIVGTRPTMDRVKESLFGMIQSQIKGSYFLDLFAGSGSVGIEAISNGAKKVYFVDQNPKVSTVLKDNLTRMHVIEEFAIITSDYEKAIQQLVLQQVTIDIVFIDPPYEQIKIEKIVDFLRSSGILTTSSLIIYETIQPNIQLSLSLIKTKKVGKKWLYIFQNC